MNAATGSSWYEYEYSRIGINVRHITPKLNCALVFHPMHLYITRTISCDGSWNIY
jgi:hypothetical protein